jgi:SAM-dependent methyltransferase
MATPQEFPCPVCGSNRYNVIRPDTLGDRSARFDYGFSPAHNLTYRTVHCLDCGHGYASPRPDNIWENYQSVVDDAYLTRKEERIASAKKALERIRTFVPSGKLLDVGCATGDFMSAAQPYYNVEGLELSEWSAKLAVERGFTIHKCLLDDMKVENVYDVVTMWGVIEHFEYPANEIKNIARIIKPGGVVALWTGDIESLPSKLFGQKWWYVQGQHIQMFSKRSIRKLFNDNGFEEVSMTWYPYVMAMRSISQSIRRYPALDGLAHSVLNSSLFREATITIKLPGEMFGIFRKR